MNKQRYIDAMVDCQARTHEMIARLMDTNLGRSGATELTAANNRIIQRINSAIEVFEHPAADESPCDREWRLEGLQLLKGHLTEAQELTGELLINGIHEASNP